MSYFMEDPLLYYSALRVRSTGLGQPVLGPPFTAEASFSHVAVPFQRVVVVTWLLLQLTLWLRRLPNDLQPMVELSEE